MGNVQDKIVKLQANLKKNQIIAIIYDEDGGEDPEYYGTFVLSHFDSDYHLLKVFHKGFSGEIFIIEDFDNVVDIFAVEKKMINKMLQVRQDKTPDNFSRHLGIEIEFISKLDSSALALKLANAGLSEFVTLKDDGSINTSDIYTHSHEICVLATEKKMPYVIRKLAKALRGNSSVNSSCGLHVHLDMRSRNPDQAYANLFWAQPLLYSMCPGTRSSNDYCKPQPSFTSFSRANDMDRYYGINKASYHAHQTIEVRIHSGTINADKINNWIALLVKIADQQVANPLRSIAMCKEYKQLKKQLKLRGNLEKYIKARISEFKTNRRETFLQIAA